MPLSPLLRGIGIGFAIAAPVGPIGLLCIRRSLRDGAMMGLATGLGAATADAVYGLVAAFGLGAITTLLLANTHLLRVAGGVLLSWLGLSGLRTAWRHRQTHAAEATARGVLAAYSSTFALTLANPATILSVLAVIAALSGPEGGVSGGAVLVGGVFLGSTLWWLILVGLVSALRRSLPDFVLRGIEITSALVLIGLGILATLSGLTAI